MTIALEDFSLRTLIIQRFWLVQRWIENESQKKARGTSLTKELYSS